MIVNDLSWLWGFRNSRKTPYPSWGFLQLEAAEVGCDLAALHGLSFTLPDGLFTLLEGAKKQVV